MTAFQLIGGTGAERLADALTRTDGKPFEIIQLRDGRTYLIPNGVYRLKDDLLNTGVLRINSTGYSTIFNLAPDSRAEMTDFFRNKQQSPNQAKLRQRMDSLGIQVSFEVPHRYPRQIRVEGVRVKHDMPAVRNSGWKYRGTLR